METENERGHRSIGFGFGFGFGRGGRVVGAGVWWGCRSGCGCSRTRTTRFVDAEQGGAGRDGEIIDAVPVERGGGGLARGGRHGDGGVGVGDGDGGAGKRWATR